MGSINYSQAIRPDTAYLRKIIESSLLADWAISIEFQSGDSETSCWLLWGKAFFAIRSAKPVLEELLNCYIRHPNSTIRISAEKFRPQTRMLYTVYNPQYLPVKSDTKPKAFPKQSPWEQGQLPSQIRLII